MTAIAITAEPPTWLRLVARLFKISIAIDGDLGRLPWGTHTIAVAAGRHIVSVGLGRAFHSKARLEVDVEPGQTVRLRYLPRPMKHLRGALVVEHLPTARVLKG